MPRPGTLLLVAVLATTEALAQPASPPPESPPPESPPAAPAPGSPGSDLRGESPRPAAPPPESPRPSRFPRLSPSRMPAGLPDATPTGAPPAPEWRLTISNLLVARVNPLGLEDQVRVGVQKTLAQSNRALFRDNFIFFGFYPKLNPAFAKLGPSVEIQPLSIFNLRVGAEMMYFFSSFAFLQSFGSPLDGYNVKATSAGPSGPEPIQNYSTTGAHLMIEPTLSFKFGPIAVRNKFAAEYWNMRVRTGDKVFFEATLDTLVPADGWVLTNDLDVLYVRELKKLTGRFEGARLVAGIRYSLVKPLYQGSDFRMGEDRSLDDNAHHRIGPLVAFTFFDKGYARFNKPSLLVILNWYLDHRYRAGQEVSQGVPYVIIGFAFQSDLWK